MSSQLNNARIRAINNYVPIYDIEEVDKKLCVWRGVPVPQEGMKEELPSFIYFSRKYMPETNDMDKVFPEICFSNKDLLGVKFYLIPKEKLYFFYEPASSTIQIPVPKVVKRRMN